MRAGQLPTEDPPEAAPALLVLSFALNFPVCRNRVSTLSASSFSLTLAGFQQRFEDTGSNSFDLDTSQDARFKVLGSIVPGQYVSRLIKLTLAAIPIRRLVQHNSIVYAVGLDAALLARLCVLGSPDVHLIVEIHDIRDASLSNRLIGRVLRLVERWILRRASALFVTSDKYLTEYYQPLLGTDSVPSEVIENKSFSRPAIHPPQFTQEERHIRIGYFGLLRCDATWQLLLRAADALRDRFRIVVAGQPTKIAGFYDDLRSNPHIIYLGPYRDPEDIQRVYCSADIVWIAGFNQKKSFHLAQSCRFYHSVAMLRPLIAQRQTADGDRVANHRIGITVDVADPSLTIESIARITPHDVTSWAHNARALRDNSVWSPEDDARLCNLILGGNTSTPTTIASCCTTSQRHPALLKCRF